MPAQLYILCGLPFSGKSTLACEMGQLLSADIVELDATNAERGLGLNGKALTSEQWDETYDIGYSRTAGLLDEGTSVIFDAPNYTRSQRDVLRKLAAQHGAEAVVLFVDAPLSDCHARLLANQATPTRSDVRDEDFANVVDHFEPPDDEHPLYYTRAVAVSTWVAMMKHTTD